MPRSKSKLSTDEVCQTYYETQIFGPGGAGDASQVGFFPDVRIYLEVRDASFKGIDVSTSTNELIAANIELFGLAWLDHQREFNADSPDNLITEEISFTKGYLTHIGREDIWERMGAYNDALATTIADSINSDGWGRFRDVSTMIYDDEYKELRDKEFIDRATDLEEHFGRQTDDGECVNRLIFRFLTIPCDMQKVTALSQNISLVFAERLGLDPKPDGLFALQRIVVGLYENAVGYLGSARDYGSYDAAKSAREDLLQGLIRWAKRRLLHNDP